METHGDTGSSRMRLDDAGRKNDRLPRVNQAVDDSALLLRAQAGDVAAFEALVERHRNRVFALALRMLGSETDAADVAQDTFIKAYRELARFRGDAQFGSWVHRIAANEALMKLRRRRVAAQVEAPELPAFNERGSLMDEVADWTRGAEEEVLDAELRYAIEHAASELPDEYREVFVLRDLEGLSYEEIAEITQDSVAAIKSRLHRARLALRAAIDRFYEERS